MAEDATFCKLQIQMGNNASHKTYFVMGHWRPASFRLTLTDGRNVWETARDERTVREQYPTPDGLAAFMQVVRESLAAPTAGDETRFSYKVDVLKANDYRFEWTIRVGTEENEDGDFLLQQEAVFKMSGGSEAREKLHGMLGWLMEREHSSSTALRQQQQRLALMERDLETALSSVARLTQEKERMEKELYQKFVLLLNEKKEHINIVQDELERVRARVKEEMKRPRAAEDDQGDVSPVKQEPGSRSSSPISPKQARTHADQSDQASSFSAPASPVRPPQRKRVRQVAAAPAPPQEKKTVPKSAAKAAAAKAVPKAAPKAASKPLSSAAVGSVAANSAKNGKSVEEMDAMDKILANME